MRIAEFPQLFPITFLCMVLSKSAFVLLALSPCSATAGTYTFSGSVRELGIRYNSLRSLPARGAALQRIPEIRDAYDHPRVLP